MPATVTLSTTTLQESVSATAKQIKVASTSGLTDGMRLYIDRELMLYVSSGVSAGNYTQVNVRRGVDGTTATPHSSTATITIGRGDQFYDSDPTGAPGETIPVSPYINLINGKVWFARGSVGPGETVRWWQEQTTTYSVGPLGVLISSSDPTAST